MVIVRIPEKQARLFGEQVEKRPRKTLPVVCAACPESIPRKLAKIAYWQDSRPIFLCKRCNSELWAHIAEWRVTLLSKR
jgi:hypothetical protein